MSPPWVDDKPGPEDPLRDVDLPVVAAIVEGPGTPDPGCPVAPVRMEVGDSGTNKRANKCFCSTSLLLASTRWVQRTHSSHCPLSSKLRCLINLSDINIFFL